MYIKIIFDGMKTKSRAGIKAMLAFFGILLAGAGAPAAAQSFTCNAHEVYSIQYVSHAIHRINTQTGASTNIGTLPAPPAGNNWNGMGMQGGGNTIYTISHSPDASNTNRGRVMSYTVGGSSMLSPAPNVSGYSGNFPSGAVNPVNGWFYAATPVTSASSNTVWGLYAYNPAWGASQAPILVGRINAQGNNGDLVFDALGNLYLLSGNLESPTFGARVYRINGPMPTTSGSGNMASTALTGLMTYGSTNYSGIAFSNGLLVLQVGNAGTGSGSYYTINPATGAQVGSVFTSAGGVDLASCQYPNTIRLQKNLPQGRFAAGNQFNLSITGGGLSIGNTGTTTGSASGLQTPIVGPVLGQVSTAYTITETGAGGTNLSNYVTEWECVYSDGAPYASGTGTSGTFTMPDSGTRGTNFLCTFTNTPRATIRLQKALPNGRLLTSDQFLLRIAGGTGADVTTTTTGGGTTATGVATQSAALAGTTYTLSESAAGSPATVLANYNTTYACTNARPGGQMPSGSGTSFSVTPVAGDDLTCTFTNTQRPRVTIQKISLGGTNTFGFSGNNGIAGHNITTTSPGVAVSGAVQTLTTVGAVTTITESAPPAGYVLTAASCTGLPSGGTATPNLTARTLTLNAAATAAGANLTCTFTNTLQPRVTIQKISLGGTNTFGFSGNNGIAGHNITTTSPGVAASGAVQTLTTVGAVTTITESAPPAGYALTAASCSGLPSGGTATADLGARTLTLNAAATAAGANLTCTFTNTLQPRVTIQKISLGGTNTFGFSGNNGIAGHNITTTSPGVAASGAVQTLTTVGQATTITESAPPAGYALTAASCSGLPSGGTATADLGARTLTLNAAATAAGANLVCTFTNTLQPRVTIQKISQGGTGTFSFTGTNGVAGHSITTTSPGVAVSGAVQTLTTVGQATTITESAPPAGYTLTTASCTGLPSGGTATADLGARTLTLNAAATAAGANLTCTFTNTLQPRVTIQKISLGGTNTFGFSGNNGIAGHNITTTSPGVAASGAVQTLTTVGAVTTITEVVPAGYTLTAASCAGAPNGSVTTNLAASTVTLGTAATVAGANITCTFTNTRSPVIRLQKSLPNGRAVAGNQFQLNISQGATVVATAITDGNTNTPAQVATLDPATIGTIYTLSELAAGTPLTVPAHYATTYACTNTRTGAPTPPSGSGTSFTLTPAAGDDLTCTFTNTTIATADLSITKTNAQSALLAGTQTTYALVALNHGPSSVTDAVIRDTPEENLSNCVLATPACEVTAGTATCPAVGSAVGQLSMSNLLNTGVNGGVRVPNMGMGGEVTIRVTCTVE